MRSIKWSYVAEQEYVDVLQFWISHNSSNTYSQKIMKAVEEAEDMLMKNPFIAEEKEDHKDGNVLRYRKLIILQNFSLIYIVRDMIEIVSFWDNRQNPKQLKSIF
ncbi:type II toxin-antitoxin system RelE/ParE family toxin [Capnocytophaga canis]|uniref:type II toxin-antitoxin system RelE/ParE family toxin n=1 Tax=Capnocytophaga canis TaxID=1848903 RepID=UPI001562D24C|nr:type II toxin-antitoxin system RelE/ParE family toxin [Capnocytophaga canis]